MKPIFATIVLALSGLAGAADFATASRARFADPMAIAQGRGAPGVRMTPPLATSALGKLAATLAPGQWATLATQNINPTLTNTSGSSKMIFGYSDAIKWDPVSRKAFYLGSDHGGNLKPGPTSWYRFVTYSEDTNAWSVLPTPPWVIGASGTLVGDAHGYDKTAINPAGRKLYRNPYNSVAVHVYDLDAGTWSRLPDAPSMAGCCDAIEFIPELNGLLWMSRFGQIVYSEATKLWAWRGNVTAFYSTWMIAEYNPVHKVTLLASSTGAMYRMSATGQLTALGDTPVKIYDGSPWNGVVTVDPVSGDYLVLTTVPRQLYVYNVITDTWRLTSSPPPAPTMNAVHGTPIGSHGVVMFTHCDNRSSCGVWLYRHAQGVGVPTPPVTPAEAAAKAAQTEPAAMKAEAAVLRIERDAMQKRIEKRSQ